ncbi:MAG: 50S ribosomal protein L29 [Candidatus Peribacteraceae bacterium]|jgi:ribosomal protein L29|nr:50S ribosomal protein L29 [Candidatus Peribacteraceae bacterium]
MVTLTTIKELRNMTADDLRKEIRQQEIVVVKLRLGVKLGNEKDSAKYIREKKQLARMNTVYSEKNNEPVSASTEAKPSVPFRSKKS